MGSEHFQFADYLRVWYWFPTCCVLCVVDVVAMEKEQKSHGNLNSAFSFGFLLMRNP